MSEATEITVTVTVEPPRMWAQIRFQYLDGTTGTAPMKDGSAFMPASCRLLAIEQALPSIVPDMAVTASLAG